MKYQFNGRMVVATAENNADNLRLLGLEVSKHEPRVTRTYTKKKHKPHLHMKRCGECGGEFKGLRALRIHQSFRHGVRSPKYEYNKKYWKNGSKKQGVKGEWGGEKIPVRVMVAPRETAGVTE